MQKYSWLDFHYRRHEERSQKGRRRELTHMFMWGVKRALAHSLLSWQVCISSHKSFFHIKQKIISTCNESPSYLPLRDESALRATANSSLGIKCLWVEATAHVRWHFNGEQHGVQEHTILHNLVSLMSHFSNTFCSICLQELFVLSSFGEDVHKGNWMVRLNSNCVV